MTRALQRKTPPRSPRKRPEAAPHHSNAPNTLLPKPRPQNAPKTLLKMPLAPKGGGRRHPGARAGRAGLLRLWLLRHGHRGRDRGAAFTGLWSRSRFVDWSGTLLLNHPRKDHPAMRCSLPHLKHPTTPTHTKTPRPPTPPYPGHPPEAAHLCRPRGGVPPRRHPLHQHLHHRHRPGGGWGLTGRRPRF